MVKSPAMFSRITLGFLIIIAWSCQNAAAATQGEVFNVPDIGFHFVPPSGMIDRTSQSAREARNHAATNKTTSLILDLSSNEADTAPNWHRLWIIIRYRGQLANLSDVAAEEKMHTVLGGPKAIAVGKPKTSVLGGRAFVVSEFELNEPPLLKHAKLFTTICKGQILTLVLVSNSAAKVGAMEDSLKTLDFSSH